MPREIKFRAWNDGVMIYEPSVAFGNINEQILSWQKDNYVLMQFVGLKDKNGKEIYEGDIVKWNSWKEGTNLNRPLNNSEVVFSEGAWRTKGNQNWNLAIYSNVEVIGNIYENPELLSPKDILEIKE